MKKLVLLMLVVTIPLFCAKSVGTSEETAMSTEQKFRTALDIKLCILEQHTRGLDAATVKSLENDRIRYLHESADEGHPKAIELTITEAYSSAIGSNRSISLVEISSLIELLERHDVKRKDPQIFQNCMNYLDRINNYNN
jgi:hypothetical protein